MNIGLKVGVITLAMSASLAMSAFANTTEIAMCTEQHMTVDTITGETRVWSEMETDTHVHEFWQYVAYNEYHVGITYVLEFDDNGNFVSIKETEW